MPELGTGDVMPLTTTFPLEARDSVVPSSTTAVPPADNVSPLGRTNASDAMGVAAFPAIVTGAPIGTAMFEDCPSTTTALPKSTIFTWE